MSTITQECRNIAKKSLKTVINVDKNIDIIEKNIYKNVINSSHNPESDKESIYKEIIYIVLIKVFKNFLFKGFFFIITNYAFI